jgi:hypothetical protein
MNQNFVHYLKITEHAPGQCAAAAQASAAIRPGPVPAPGSVGPGPAAPGAGWDQQPVPKAYHLES